MNLAYKKKESYTVLGKKTTYEFHSSHLSTFFFFLFIYVLLYISYCLFYSFSAKLKIAVKAQQINTPHLNSSPPKYSVGDVNILVNIIDSYGFFKDAVLSYQYLYLNNNITLNSNKTIIRFNRSGNFEVTVNALASKGPNRMFYASSAILLDVRGM